MLSYAPSHQHRCVVSIVLAHYPPTPPTRALFVFRPKEPPNPSPFLVDATAALGGPLSRSRNTIFQIPKALNTLGKLEGLNTLSCEGESELSPIFTATATATCSLPPRRKASE